MRVVRHLQVGLFLSPKRATGLNFMRSMSPLPVSTSLRMHLTYARVSVLLCSPVTGCLGDIYGFVELLG